MALSPIAGVTIPAHSWADTNDDLGGRCLSPSERRKLHSLLAEVVLKPLPTAWLGSTAVYSLMAKWLMNGGTNQT